MLTYLKCKKDTGNINSKVIKTKNGRLISLSKCAVSGSKNQDLCKKSRFIKEQAKGLRPLNTIE